MAQTLELQFETVAGKSFTLSVDQPRQDLNEVEIQTGMQAIIDSDVFRVEISPLGSVKGARLVERNVTDLLNS